MDPYTRVKRSLEAAGFEEANPGNFVGYVFIRSDGTQKPALETSDDRIRRYLALLDLLVATEGLAPLAAEQEDPESLYVRLDVAYDALSGAEMERVERIHRGEEPRP